MQMIFGSSKAPSGDIDVLNLSGTSSSPRVKLNVEPFGGESAVSWLIGCNDAPNESILSGQVQSSGVGAGDTPNYASVDTSTDWVIPIGFVVTYYVRATLVASSAPTEGSGLDTWLTLAPSGANRLWTWRQSVSGTLKGTLKIEIATDSLGANIVATGHYRGTATVRFPT